ncbi:hypothetical protein [Staphylococcus equorum]|uniref:hypothetical protein n=1 Tax=Staphylococcus equorum TaxID=246432 RepID=UPI002174E24B|nr:hypothetical protein [Staphylococcus equorum]
MMQLSPFIKVDDVDEAVNFYKNAFGGEEKNIKRNKWTTTAYRIACECNSDITYIKYIRKRMA